MGAEVIDQGAGDGGLTDAAFVGSDENDSRSGHSGTLQDEMTDPMRQYLTLSARANDRFNSAS
jgi:hypothetical protein